MEAVVEAVVEAPVGQLGRRLERLLQMKDIVVLGVTALQPAQGLHGLLHAKSVFDSTGEDSLAARWRRNGDDRRWPGMRAWLRKAQLAHPPP